MTKRSAPAPGQQEFSFGDEDELSPWDTQEKVTVREVTESARSQERDLLSGEMFRERVKKLQEDMIKVDEEYKQHGSRTPEFEKKLEHIRKELLALDLFMPEESGTIEWKSKYWQGGGVSCSYAERFAGLLDTLIEIADFIIRGGIETGKEAWALHNANAQKDVQKTLDGLREKKPESRGTTS